MLQFLFSFLPESENKFLYSASTYISMPADILQVLGFIDDDKTLNNDDVVSEMNNYTRLELNESSLTIN